MLSPETTRQKIGSSISLVPFVSRRHAYTSADEPKESDDGQDEKDSDTGFSPAASPENRDTATKSAVRLRIIILLFMLVTNIP